MINYALCIGINRYGNGANLAGCENDARDWAAAAAARGAEVELLLDADATRRNIIGAIMRLVAKLRPGQTGLIAYSGHGTEVPDASGDERDGLDEAICPVDLWTAGVLTDDELQQLYSVADPHARVLSISDACHSGTSARVLSLGGLPGRPGRIRFLPAAAFLPAERLTAAPATGARSRPGLGRLWRVLRARLRRTLRRVGCPRSTPVPRTAALLAGCKDAEFSYDASFPDPTTGRPRPNGAFTRVALDALDALPAGATLRDWYRAIREGLPSVDYPQTPQLVATRAQKRWPAL